MVYSLYSVCNPCWKLIHWKTKSRWTARRKEWRGPITLLQRANCIWLCLFWHYSTFTRHLDGIFWTHDRNKRSYPLLTLQGTSCYKILRLFIKILRDGWHLKLLWVSQTNNIPFSWFINFWLLPAFMPSSLILFFSSQVTITKH